MKKFTLFVAALALAGAAVTVACGPTTDDGTGTGGIKTCTADADCGSNSICHPTGKVCVPTCNAAADCPENQKNCAPIGSGTTKVCQCQTSQLCNSGGSTDQICSGTDNICEKKCATDSDCSGFTSRKCDTAKGECVAGTPTTTKCTANADCASSSTGKVCNTTSGACVACLANSDCTTAGDTCDTATNTCKPATASGCDATKNGGVDTCTYGKYCGTGNMCVTPDQSCAAAMKYAPAVVADKSPVIWGVTMTGTRAAMEGCTGTGTTGCACGTQLANKYQGKWFDPEANLTSTGSYNKIAKISNTGSNPGTGGNTFKNTTITVDAGGKSGTFTFELCSNEPANVSGVVVYDDAGNESNVACY